MYDVPIVPTPIQKRRARVQELDELEQVNQHMEEVPSMIQTQSETGYVSLMIMMPTYGT